MCYDEGRSVESHVPAQSYSKPKHIIEYGYLGMPEDAWFTVQAQSYTTGSLAM